MLISLILSGGAGTRLWPVSREGHPKPFLQLADGESLLQKTLARAARLPEASEIVVLTNRDYFFPSQDEARLAIDSSSGIAVRYLLEPAARNTLPAITLGALSAAASHGPDTLLLVLPADHLILDEAAFGDDVRAAMRLAEDDFLVTFGIRPKRAETGFGYIHLGEALGEAAFAVARFTEKPTREVAMSYVADGQHLWNAGMFCFRAGTLLQELERLQPDFLHDARACLDRSDLASFPACNLDESTFNALPDLSIDYGLMERTNRVAVVPAHFDWSDIGSWNALADLCAPDRSGNRHEGDAVFIDSHNCYVRAEDRLVATVGVRDLFIVETADAILVSDAAHAQQVKDVVGALKLRSHDAATMHRTVLRPWGAYTVLEEGPGFKIKRIEVKPGGRLSLQMHRHRSEHWVVVSGRARITNDSRVFEIGANESTYISPGHRHRLENAGTDPLVLIEVQCGGYLGEDDIVRLEDIYGREAGPRRSGA